MLLLACVAEAKRKTVLVSIVGVVEAHGFHARGRGPGADRCKTKCQHQAEGQGSENNSHMDMQLVHADTMSAVSGCDFDADQSRGTKRDYNR